jgi:tetratricopeptide (TPR) repeat protein
MVTLTKRLGGLPLAIVLAGSYMHETGISPSKYLELYHKSWKDLQKYAQPHRYYSNGNLVGTWMISYQEIQKSTPSAAKLLLLLACYDNQDIWYDLINQGIQAQDAPSWLLEVAGCETDFLHAVKALLGFSLIQSRSGSDGYSLHPVVQDWCQGYMLDKKIKDEVNGIAIISIGLSVPHSSKPQYWTLQQRLLPHADRILEMVQDIESLSAHPIVLDTINNLGILYKAQGKLQEAETMYQRALAGKETALGPDHSSTLATVNNLGNLYADQGKLQEAETMYQRALAGYETALGPDHSSTLATVNNLGNLYADQGKLQEANTMYQRALAGYKTALGPDHTDTLMTVNNLGNLYADQGKLQEAETMYHRALASYEKALGPDHYLTRRVVDELHQLTNRGVSYILYPYEKNPKLNFLARISQKTSKENDKIPSKLPI